MGSFALVTLSGLIFAVSLSGTGAQISCPDYLCCVRMDSYRFFRECKTWSNAERFCMDQGCQLASIHHMIKSAHFPTFGSQLLQLSKAWIGLKQGNWQWSDGSDTAYAAWGNNEPHNFCAALWEKPGYLKWKNVDCDSILPFLCKFPVSE